MELYESLYFSILINGLSGGMRQNTCMPAGARRRRNGSDTIGMEVFKRLHECLNVVYIIYKIIYNLEIFTIYTTTASTSQWRGRITHIQLVVITPEMIAAYTQHLDGVVNC